MLSTDFPKHYCRYISYLLTLAILQKCRSENFRVFRRKLDCAQCGSPPGEPTGCLVVRFRSLLKGMVGFSRKSVAVSALPPGDPKGGVFMDKKAIDW